MREKEEFIRDFNEAFSNNDLDFILNNMSDNIVWNMIGEKTIEGKKAVKEFMEPMSKIETLELELLGIVSREQSAAAHGRMKIKDSSGGIKSFGFADFYEFEGINIPKVSKMTSYVVENKEQQK